jgi:hypothetical protein
VPAPRPPAGGNAAGTLRWAALDSSNERLATAADSVPADLTDTNRELKAS